MFCGYHDDAWLRSSVQEYVTRLTGPEVKVMEMLILAKGRERSRNTACDSCAPTIRSTQLEMIKYTQLHIITIINSYEEIITLILVIVNIHIARKRESKHLNISDIRNPVYKGCPIYTLYNQAR